MSFYLEAKHHIMDMVDQDSDRLAMIIKNLVKNRKVNVINGLIKLVVKVNKGESL